MSFSGKTRTDQPAKTLQNSAFFPDLDLKAFIDTYRIPSDHPIALVEEQVYLAMGTINKQLDIYRAAQIALGYDTLAAVPADEMGGKSIQIRRYERAVFALAKAKLLQDFATVIRKKEAENLGKEAPEREEKYREFSTQAVREILGKSAISVELL